MNPEESWQKHLGKVAAIEPIAYLGPIAGGIFTREIMSAVRAKGKPEILGGEEFLPVLAAEDSNPYSMWIMRFGEEGERPSRQDWHRHVIPGKGTEYPEYISHRLLLLICSGGEAGVERCKVAENGEATGKIIHYSFKPDTLYALRFDGDDIHRFTSEHKNVVLAAFSFHSFDRYYGLQGMNSATVIYDGPVPKQVEYVSLPDIGGNQSELTVNALAAV